MNAPAVPRTWALVLAGGAGRRLASLTTDGEGNTTPKQFCSLLGGPTLVQQTLARTHGVVAPSRTMVVVTRAHRRHWTRNLTDVPASNIIEQPGLRGTAAGILLPLLALADRDPRARLLIVPSDHHVESPGVFMAAVALALESIDEDDQLTVLLGITPDTPDIEYGWIVPDEIDALGRIGVRRFVEKPPHTAAVALRRRGALWNSFVMATSVPALLALFRARLPALLDAVLAARSGDELTLERAWSSLPCEDFSAAILGQSAPLLRVQPVAPCGWTDLGTPARIASIAAVGDGVGASARGGALVLVRRSA